MFAPAHPVLVRDRVRCVGDPVAFLVAETVAQAEDAAELVRIEYEPLPSVTATAEAVRSGSPPGVGRVPRQRLQRLRGRRPGGGRRRVRAGRSRRPRPLRDHAGCTPSTWSREARWASTTPARTATRSTPTSSTRTACATCWRRASSGFPSTGSGSSRGTSAAPSGPRAGSTPSTGWCCGPRGSWGGRSSGRASGARRSWPTSTPGTP